MTSVRLLSHTPALLVLQAFVGSLSFLPPRVFGKSFREWLVFLPHWAVLWCTHIKDCLYTAYGVMKSTLDILSLVLHQILSFKIKKKLRNDLCHEFACVNASLQAFISETGWTACTELPLHHASWGSVFQTPDSLWIHFLSQWSHKDLLFACPHHNQQLSRWQFLHFDFLIYMCKWDFPLCYYLVVRRWDYRFTCRKVQE